MRSSLRQRCLGLAAIAFASTVARADDSTAQLRFLSVATRDRLPTVDEAKRLHDATDKDAALDALVDEWLASPEHEARVARHFNDMFGVAPHVFLTDQLTDLIQYPQVPGEAPPDLATPGVWHLPVSVKATCGGVTAQPVPAWWSDTPILMCNSAVKTSWANTLRCTDPFGGNGMRNVGCGCGPDQFFCYPRHLKKNAVRGVAREFADRGVHAYAQGLSWLDLLGGDQFYGDRFLLHHYMFQEKTGSWPSETLPTEGEIAFLKTLPVDGAKTLVDFPPSMYERSGVVTAPAFLRRFNNFRSRIRALTEQLLCRDVDAGLNTDGIDVLVNTSLSQFDMDHGSKAECSSCHFALDNFGSTLLGWNDQGMRETWWSPSQLGHVFGQDGSGPRFLMQSYIERGSGFAACMAKKAFEGFSGNSWDDAPAAAKAHLTALAAQGPRPLIDGMLRSTHFRAMRSGGSKVTYESVPVTYDFKADIDPILSAACGGTDCHGAGNARGASFTYVGNEAAFKAAPAARISSGSMPPPGSGRTLSPADKDKLLLFLAQ